MRWRLTLVLVLVFAGMSRADDDTRRAQVAAATANAVTNLLTDIEAEPINSSVTVHLLLDDTHARPRILTALQQAQQIGGPRWLDEQTCQVRLEIPASAVSRELIAIAGADPKLSPISSSETASDLKSWDSRVFSATGTSTARVEALRPPATSKAWQNVSDDDVQSAVVAARQSAVKRVLDSIAPVPLAGGKTIGDALAIPAIASAMAQWLGDRPVTLVDFRDDRKVEVTLAVSSAAVYDKLRALLSPRKDIAVPADEKEWTAVANSICPKMASPVGLGSITHTTVAATQLTIIPFPTEPPDWTARQLDAEGTGQAAESKLRSARQAELAGIQTLRDQVCDLPLTPSQTVGAAAAADPRIAAALDRAVHRGAHVYSVDYRPDGSVAVRLSLDLREVWEEIARGR